MHFKKVLADFLKATVLCLLPLSLFAKNLSAPLINVVSLSSDGHYAISANQLHQAILWNLSNHKFRLLSEQVNPNSVYFIKDSDRFIWQTLSDNDVHLQNVQSDLLLSFHVEPLYAQVMSQFMRHYFASYPDGHITYGFEQHMKIIQPSSVKASHHILLTMNMPKHLVLSYSTSQPHYLKPRGDLTLWDSHSGHLLHRFAIPQLISATALSPNGDYILADDRHGHLTIWSTATYKQTYRFAQLDKSSLKPPKYFDISALKKEKIYSLCFVSDDYFLEIPMYQPYAILYKLGNPNPIKYYYLGRKPLVVQNDEGVRAVSSSWEGHLLLMTIDSKQSGLVEYRFNPRSLALKKVWYSGQPSAPKVMYKKVDQHPHVQFVEKQRGPKPRHWYTLVTKFI